MSQSPATLSLFVAMLICAVAGAKDRPAKENEANNSTAPVNKQSLDPEHAARFAEGLKLFKSDVRQVLTGRCVKCHGGEETESEFDLNTREGLIKGGAAGEAVVVGKAKESRLVELITHADEPVMPADGAKLTDRDIASIAKWIDLGAPYDRPLVEKSDDPLAWTREVIDPSARDYWAFRPLADVAPPRIDGDTWSRTPIDRFVLARQQEKGLTPNSPAGRQTLIRRAYFDLVGLPPALEEVADFLADDDPRAYEKLIDRLLKSPHYGERWGRHWLDVARFAESHGFEQDYNREHAYHFRDFVIKALNRDMPYDRFVRWQLAGDEIAPQNPLAQMATGFLGAGVFPTQITKNEVERTRYDALDDMAATTGAAMLGLTVGCARCHNHKFDPIPQADYYRFVSTFTTAVRSNQQINLEPQAYKKEKAAFDKAHAPLAKALADYEAEQLPKRLAEWEQNEGVARLDAPWIVLDISEMKSAGGATLEKQPDGSILATGKNADFDSYTFVAKTNLAGITGVRLEALADPSMKKSGPGRAENGNFALTDFRVTIAPQEGAGDGEAKPESIALAEPRATFEQKGLPLSAVVDDDKKSGWAVDPQFGRKHAAGFALEQPIGGEGGSLLTFTLAFNNNKQHNLGRVRLSVCTTEQSAELAAGGVAESILAALNTVSEKRTAAQQAALLKWFAPRDESWSKLNRQVRDHLQQAPQPKLATVMVVSEGVKPMRHHTQGADFFEKTFFLHRGDTDQKLVEADQGFLQVLMRADDNAKHWRVEPPDDWSTSYRRRSLANWITDTEYGAGHLLARVIVNRLWQHHLGRGIVATANDFGAQGEPPTHPRLLDWLAAELIRGGWRLKPMHKLIMTSAAYMQSGEFSEGAAAIDPGNVWLWRCEPRRVEAEIIRDSMLAASGLLDATMYGPGTLDESHQRRSIYFMVKRSQLTPMMQLFDAPEPLVSVGSRPSTTIAPQALMFLNNPQVRKYALGFARRIEPRDGETTADAVRRGYLIALSRPPTDAELEDAAAFVDSQSDSYAAAEKPDSRRLALADFCQALLCMNEFVYVE